MSHKYPINPNDGFAYVWDWNNDEYVRVLNPGDHIREDYEICENVPGAFGSAKRLMEAHGLVLNFADRRSEAELNERGNCTLFLDRKGKVIGLYHDVGVVASIPEWKDVDWEKVNS